MVDSTDSVDTLLTYGEADRFTLPIEIQRDNATKAVPGGEKGLLFELVMVR